MLLCAVSTARVDTDPVAFAAPPPAPQYRVRYEAYKAREAERAAALREQLAAVERGEGGWRLCFILEWHMTLPRVDCQQYRAAQIAR